jgi:hypothetical protein
MSKLQQWYYEVMGSALGPISGAELKQKAQLGQIQFDTPVRLGTDGKWQPAERVKGLLPPPVAALVSAPAPVAAVAPAPTKAPSSFEMDLTYHLQGDDKPHNDADSVQDHEYDFFRFVGFEQAIGPKLHRVLDEHCRTNRVTLTQATRRALAEFLGRKDLLEENATANAEAATPAPATDGAVG